jgi:hypothetical protein
MFEGTDEIDKLLGEEFFFYGAAEHQFKIDEMVWEVIEDPDDGYRSYMQSVLLAEPKTLFFSEPIAMVKLVQTEEFYRLLDLADDHEWLTFGTDNSEDYYPMFVFRYHPKLPQLKPPKLKPKKPVRDPWHHFFEERG